MGNELIEIEEYRDLKDKFDSMTKYYLSLIEEKEDLLFKEKVFLEAKYLSIFGYLIKQKLQREIDLRRIKKKISLIQFYLNKGEKVDKERVEEKLEEEMKLFKFQMEDFKERLSDSKKLIESPTLTDEEYNEVKSIFRKLAKKLHPDLNKTLTEREMNLWNRTLEAYNCNDLETLRLLANILIEEIEVERISSLELLKNKIQDLSSKIDCILEEITNNKEQFPLNIKDKILDNEWVSEEIDSYKKVITQLEEAIKSYSAFLKGIEEES